MHVSPKENINPIIMQSEAPTWRTSTLLPPNQHTSAVKLEIDLFRELFYPLVE